jgi:hypothetical protein
MNGEKPSEINILRDSYPTSTFVPKLEITKNMTLMPVIIKRDNLFINMRKIIKK